MGLPAVVIREQEPLRIRPNARLVLLCGPCNGRASSEEEEEEEREQQQEEQDEAGPSYSSETGGSEDDEDQDEDEDDEEGGGRCEAQTKRGADEVWNPGFRGAFMSLVRLASRARGWG